jgi:ribosomal protein L11 methylase PrmA
MPYLLSLGGLSMARKYLINWYILIPVYLKLVDIAVVKFRNGKRIQVSRNEHAQFRDELFQEYLKDHGFTFEDAGDNILATTDNNVKLLLQKDYTNVLDEIFVRKAYGVDYFIGKNVIDVGASIGDTALYYASNGASNVFGFEMDKERYDLCVKNIQLNSMSSRIKIMNESAYSNSIRELILEKDLHNVVVKLDCEGCEFEIIGNLTQDVFDRIDYIVMEYHSDPHKIIKKLTDAGFILRKEKKTLIPEGFMFAFRKGVTPY